MTSVVVMNVDDFENYLSIHDEDYIKEHLSHDLSPELVNEIFEEAEWEWIRLLIDYNYPISEEQLAKVYDFEIQTLDRGNHYTDNMRMTFEIAARNPKHYDIIGEFIREDITERPERLRDYEEFFGKEKLNDILFSEGLFDSYYQATLEKEKVLIELVEDVVLQGRIAIKQGYITDSLLQTILAVMRQQTELLENRN